MISSKGYNTLHHLLHQTNKIRISSAVGDVQKSFTPVTPEFFRLSKNDDNNKNDTRGIIQRQQMKVIILEKEIQQNTQLHNTTNNLKLTWKQNQEQSIYSK